MLDAPAPRSTPEESIAELSKALHDAMQECYRHNRDYHHQTPDEKLKYWSWLLKVPYRTIFEDLGLQEVIVRERQA